MSGQRSSRFVQATKTDRRLKLLLWGDSGAGKSTLALRFPGVVVIDLEDEAAHDISVLDLDVPPAIAVAELMSAVNWLTRNTNRKGSA